MSVRSAISYLVIISIYLTGQYIETGFGFTVYWFYFPYLLAILLGSTTSNKFDIKILVVLLAITVWSFLTARLSYGLVIKQLFNITFSLLAFYYLLRLEKFNFEALLKKYIDVSKIVLILGYIQVAMVLVGKGDIYRRVFPFLIDTSMGIRFQSITAEPSFLALAMTPAVFLALTNLFYRRKLFFGTIWSILFIVGYILTFATTAYLALLLSLLILYFRNFTVTKLLLSGFVLAVFFVTTIVVYQRVEAVRIRIDDTFTGISGDFMNDNRYKAMHLSSYMAVSNFYAANRAFQEHPLTGYGLGSHELVYDMYIPPELRRYTTLGRNDAGSMGIRLISETGLIGLTAFLIFTFAFKRKSRQYFTQEQNLLWIINGSVFVLIMLYLVRNGNYTINGKMLFLLLYYYTSRALEGKWLPPYLKHEEQLIDQANEGGLDISPGKA